MDLAVEYSVPLPMKVIADIIGIPSADWSRYQRWSDAILRLSYTRSGGEQAERAGREFEAATGEMSAYVAEMISERRSTPRDDLLTRLIQAEVDSERLCHDEILGFFQLLVVAGLETTSDLINNAILCLLENPDQLSRLRAAPHLLPSAIEEALRYRSPIQWMMRTPRRDVELHGVRYLPERSFFRLSAPRIGTLAGSRTPIVSTLHAIPIRTLRSDTAFISVWGRRFRVWRPESRLQTCWGASRISNYRLANRGSREPRSTCTDRHTCLSTSSWIAATRLRPKGNLLSGLT